MQSERATEVDEMNELESGCRQCGGDLASEQTDGVRQLVCTKCGHEIAVAPVLGVWPFSAAVSPRATFLAA